MNPAALLLFGPVRTRLHRTLVLFNAIQQGATSSYSHATFNLTLVTINHSPSRAENYLFFFI